MSLLDPFHRKSPRGQVQGLGLLFLSDKYVRGDVSAAAKPCRHKSANLPIVIL